MDPLNVAALRVALGVVEADEAARLRKELADLKARVGEGETNRPLHADDVVELECGICSPSTRRVLVRHLPAELRALCEWLAEGCTHAGQRFEMLPQPYEPYEHLGLGPEAVKAFDEAVAQVAGVEPAMVLPAWAESDYEPSPSYSGSMLGNGLRIGQSNASFAYVAAWAVQNQLATSVPEAGMGGAHWGRHQGPRRCPRPLRPRTWTPRCAHASKPARPSRAS